MVGAEKVKLYADNESQLFLSEIVVVAIELIPASFTT
jgi:hypothetical protein